MTTPDGTLSVAHAHVAGIVIAQDFETQLGAEQFARWATACRVGALTVRDWDAEWTVTRVKVLPPGTYWRVIVQATRTFDVQEEES